mmetsp:Transcript_8863/g.15088  ORF Transcript_8863/g.15088 Transcript_8863/m.15088 type:complete len:91 (-) Transcript_8863:27-299(-)
MSNAADSSEMGSMNPSTSLMGWGVRLVRDCRKVGLENARQNSRHSGSVAKTNIDVPSDIVRDGGCWSAFFLPFISFLIMLFFFAVFATTP